MRLQAGQAAPDFLRPDIGGKKFRLSDYRGRYLLLSFYRYASCPFCNLRVHELMQQLVEFDQRGLSLVAVFQSAGEGIREGSITLVPADFLIGADGTILLAYYGKDISDHLPVEIILQQLGAQRAA